MRLLRLLLVLPILICFLPQSNYGEDTKSAVTTNATPTQTPESRPDGFFRGIIYEITKKFMSNKSQNALTVQQITDKWNDTVTKLTKEINTLSDQVKSVSGSLSSIMNLGNSSKDMIGKLLTAAATGVSSVSDVLNIVNSMLAIVNEMYQGFNGLTDLGYNAYQRNYNNIEDMLTYAPKEVIIKLTEIYKQIMALIEKVREIVVAFSDQVNIFLLRLSVDASNKMLPIREGVVAFSNVVNEGLAKVIEMLDNLRKSTEDMISRLTNAASTAMKNTVDTTSSGIGNLLHALDNIKDTIFGIFKPKSDSKAATLAGGDAETIASTAGTTIAAVKA